MALELNRKFYLATQEVHFGVHCAIFVIVPLYPGNPPNERLLPLEPLDLLAEALKPEEPVDFNNPSVILNTGMPPLMRRPTANRGTIS
jgi:hypothetical protein